MIPAHEKSCSPLTIEHRRYHLTTTRIATVLAAGLLLALSAAACGEDVSGQGFALDITEVAVTEVGKTEFENVGVTVPELNCTATAAADATTDADGVATDYSVACTGTTDDGKEVTMDGSTEEGVFVGEVEGEEVFRKDCNDEIC